jgi:hypothetical protein
MIIGPPGLRLAVKVATAASTPAMNVVHAESHGDWAARGWPATNIAAKAKSVFEKDREFDLELYIRVIL